MVTGSQFPRNVQQVCEPSHWRLSILCCFFENQLNYLWIYLKQFMMLDEGWFHIGQLNTLPCVCFLFLELRKVKRSFKIEDKRLNKIWNTLYKKKGKHSDVWWRPVSIGRQPTLSDVCKITSRNTNTNTNINSSINKIQVKHICREHWLLVLNLFAGWKNTSKNTKTSTNTNINTNKKEEKYKIQTHF